MKFKESGRQPSKHAAGLMLGGILSDTLGLRGVTTTQSDKDAVQFLQPFAEVEDFQEFYTLQARAKSGNALTDPLAEVFSADLKTYSEGSLPNGEKVGIAIGAVEVAGTEIYTKLLQKDIAEISSALDEVRTEYMFHDGVKKYDHLLVFIFVVDTENLVSTLMMGTKPDGRSTEHCMARWALEQATLAADKECRPPAITESVLGADTGSGLRIVQIGTGTCVSRKTQMQPTLKWAAAEWVAGNMMCED